MKDKQKTGTKAALNPKPPEFSARILAGLSRYREEYSSCSDMEEEFQEKVIESGLRKAGHWYRIQVFRSLPSYIRHVLLWSLIMYRNYFVTGLRQIRRRKGYSIINIAGLAMGMTCCALMLLWVQDELSYDRFHAKADRLYRVARESRYQHLRRTSRTPAALGISLKKELPEVESAARLDRQITFFKSEGKTFTQVPVAMVDPAFLEMFTLSFVLGEKETALQDPNSVILTQEFSRKCFSERNPLGKVINLGNRIDLRVTGVIANIPHNSHLNFDVLLPFSARSEGEKKAFGDDNWRVNVYDTYVLLKERVSGIDLSPKVDGLVKRHVPRTSSTFYLQPVLSIHLQPLDGEGNGKYLYIFSALAVFILIIACINFTGLATARSGLRAREVGMRKTVGARRTDLIRQFMGESMLFALFSLTISGPAVFLLLPLFNSISGKRVPVESIDPLFFLAGMTGIALVSGILSGIYPALFLSSFHPARILRESLSSGRGGAGLRKFLVVFQFSVSILLIVCAIVVHSQIGFMRNQDQGFDQNGLVYFGSGGEFQSRFESLRNELIQHPEILSVSRGNPPVLMEVWTSQGVDWEGKNPEIEVTVGRLPVGYDYFQTMGLRIVRGRDFSQVMPTDLENGFIVNEEFIRVMGQQDGFGKTISIGKDSGRIIGIVKDFHHNSFHQRIRPVVFDLNPDESYMISIRVDTGRTAAALAVIENIWNRAVPGYPFEYEFLDSSIDAFYRSEQRMGRLFDSFTIVAVLTACLGLMGLASFAAELRTKEIGIRKILGASRVRIFMMISRDFTIWVLIANLGAWPCAYFLIDHWLKSFAYRISLTPVFFALAALLTYCAAILTVGYQAYKAASADPVKSLKYE